MGSATELPVDNPDSGKKYGVRIRQLRESLKMTQGVFADMAGVTVRAQRNYEAGISHPGVTYLESLAMNGVDFRYIITGNKPSSAHDLLAPYSHAFHWLADTLGLDEKTRDRIATVFDDARRAPPGEGRPDWATLQEICAEKCIGQIDAGLLSEILSAIDKIAPSLPVRKKAGITSLLYRAFRASGQIDPRAVKDAVDLAS